MRFFLCFYLLNYYTFSGGGKLGRQLAEAFLNFSKVNPEELQISTRQPDTLRN